jgi:dTMP kinase
MKYHLAFDQELRKNPHNGLFIAFEGIDGSGKSVQIKRLKEHLEEKGKSVLLYTPFDGEIGLFTRKILAGEKTVPGIALQYLISANRSLQQESVEEHVKTGGVVLYDRYFWSAVVYGILDQTHMDPAIAKNWLLITQSILTWYHQFLAPNFTLFLEVSPKTAMVRIHASEKKKEIYEEEAKIRKLAEIYEWVRNEFSAEFVTVDAERSIDEVAKDVVQIVEQKL